MMLKILSSATLGISIGDNAWNRINLQRNINCKKGSAAVPAIEYRDKQLVKSIM